MWKAAATQENEVRVTASEGVPGNGWLSPIVRRGGNGSSCRGLHTVRYGKEMHMRFSWQVTGAAAAAGFLLMACETTGPTQPGFEPGLQMQQEEPPGVFEEPAPEPQQDLMQEPAEPAPLPEGGVMQEELPEQQPLPEEQPLPEAPPVEDDPWGDPDVVPGEPMIEAPPAPEGDLDQGFPEPAPLPEGEPQPLPEGDAWDEPAPLPEDDVIIDDDDFTMPEDDEFGFPEEDEIIIPEGSEGLDSDPF